MNPQPMRPVKVAVVHDWLVTFGGAERTLAHILECYPTAEVFTVVDFLPGADRTFLDDHRVHTSFVQRLPLARRLYRNYLPLMPLAIESFDLSAFELVISSSHSVAKGVLTGPGQTHVSYVHSPMRYAWDLQHQYLREHGLEKGWRSPLARLLLQRMRAWDYRTANGVDCFVSNSQFIARRIWKTYRREATVVHPPVDTEFFRPPVSSRREDFYLTASRLVPYKRIGLIVEAFARLPDRRLVVIGDGPEYARLRRRAPANVTLLGRQPARVLREYLQRARAFVFAALEDFGIAPVEAQACGAPVIAFGEGGAAESVIDGSTGVLFDVQSVESLLGAIRQFELREKRFCEQEIRMNALRFSADHFRRKLVARIDEQLQRALTSHQVAG